MTPQEEKDLRDRLEQATNEARVMRQNWRSALQALKESESANRALQATIKELQRSVEDICIGSCPECPPDWKK